MTHKVSREVRANRVRKKHGLAISVVLSIAIACGYLWAHSEAMKRASRYNAYVNLQKAYQSFIQYGRITNPAPETAQFYSYTNRVSIQNSNYDCVIGMTWRAYSGAGDVLAVTRDGTTIWFDATGTPRLFNPGKPSR